MVLAVLIASFFLFPHGDLSVRIAEKTAEIRLNPHNGILYVQRGQLYFQHEQPDSALTDYKMALEQGLDSALVYLMIAEAQLSLKLSEEGLSSIGKYLSSEPNNLKGIHTRGRLLQALGDLPAAIADFEFVLARASSPRPQDFLELADLRSKTEGTDSAIETLKSGCLRLGNIVSLQLRILELEKERKNFEAAHVVLDRMMAPLSRKERLMVEKAELYLLQGNQLAAKKTLSQAETAIASLPARFQNVDAIIELKERIITLQQTR